MKKLYRCKDGKKLCGVCIGIAKYFDIDPTIVRLLWVLISLAMGCGVLAYIICAIVIPYEPAPQQKAQPEPQPDAAKPE